MQSIVALFTLAKRADGRSPRTIQDYHRCLDPFAAWCTAQSLTLGNLTRSDVRRYVVKLRSNGWSEATVGIHIRNLRTFLRWCYDEELITSNLALAMQAPRQIIRDETPLSPHECAHLVAACTGDQQATRDKALILMFIDTGLRIGEMASIKRDDVHITGEGRGWIRIYATKTKTYRFVILGQRVVTALTKYLGQRRDKYVELWIGKRGPLAKEAIYRIVKKRGAAAGIKRVHPHIFRRTFATLWFDNDGDPERLRVLAGWSSATLALMLKTYIGSDREQLAAAHVKAGPVDNLPL